MRRGQSNVMRLFLAVDISQEIRTNVRALLSELAPRIQGARWVPPENLHLTLRFLGQTREEAIEPLCSGCQELARKSTPFELSVVGLACFPSARRPRVLWLGIAEPAQALSDLQQGLERYARSLGYPAETRPFTPHLTLARFRTPRGQPGLVHVQKTMGQKDFGTTRVQELVLYRSILGRTGAHYQPLRSFALGGSEPG